MRKELVKKYCSRKIRKIWKIFMKLFQIKLKNPLSLSEIEYRNDNNFDYVLIYTEYKSLMQNETWKLISSLKKGFLLNK